MSLPTAASAPARPNHGLRPMFVLCRPKTAAERASVWGVEYPVRFFRRRAKNGAILTTDSLTGRPAVFYVSPLLARTAAELRKNGFRIMRLLVVEADDVFDPYTNTRL